MKRELVADLPLLVGLLIGFMTIVYFFLLPQFYTLESDYQLTFFFVTIGMSMFCGLIGLIAGMAAKILLAPGFWERYTSG